ncbi:MAG TPA: ATP synthase F1 subunit gamma [Bryobacteraceae bacterium]|nr:ATP synthase F1 subunit gamma [Bryobacteraceae bacterium]
MPSLIDIRRRIRSVKNMKQITKAMKMVSAAKLRRAQDKVIAARPYAQSMQRMLANVALAASADEMSEIPLLAKREEKRIQLIVVTADRGLAGAFNANVNRAALRFIQEHRNADVALELVGRRARDFFRKRHKNITGEYATFFQKNVRYEDALQVAGKVIERFEKGEIDAVYLVVNHFRNVVVSDLSLTRILPVELPENRAPIDYIYEQRPHQLLRGLLPRYIQAEIYRAMLESSAAEHAARMTAMDAATTNAGDVIDHLTLTMNRVRQASITREIIEIVSGAAALD